MKTKNMLLLLLVSFAFTGCSNKILLKSDFWQKKETAKIGVAVKKYPECGAHRQGNEGLLDMAINAAVTNKFDTFLKKLDISEFSNSKILFSEKLKGSGFNAKSLQDLIDLEIYSDFNKTNQGDFFNKDLRPLSNKENIDYLVLLSVEQCGTLRSYYGFIPIGRPTVYFKVSGQLIDLKDNSILWRTEFKTQEDSFSIVGEWDSPPDFPEIIKTLKNAIVTKQNILMDAFYSNSK